MKAVVLKKPREIRIEDVPVPTLKSDEVLVKVAACGICGSDIRYFEGENPWALHTLGEERPNPPNIILGHEFAGEVVEVGNSSLKELMGKRVVVSPYKACGLCRFCRTGRYNLCTATTHLGHGAGWGEMEYYPGGMAEYCQVWADKVYPLSGSISSVEATLLDIVGVAIHGMNVAGMAPGSEVLVMGTGPLGISLVQIARIWGAKRVFCTDTYRKPLELALKVGADETIEVGRDDVVERILEKTDGCGVDVVVDTVGTTKVQMDALRVLAASGTLVNMATNANPISLKLMDLGSERVMRSSSNYFFHEFQMALDLAAAGKVSLSPLITHKFPLEQAVDAFDVAIERERNQALKVVLEM